MKKYPCRNLVSDTMASAEDDSFDFMSLAKASAEVGMKLYKEVSAFVDKFQLQSFFQYCDSNIRLFSIAPI